VNNRRSPFLLSGGFLVLEHSAHSRRGLLLGREVQVGVDVGGGGEGAVAQPDLDLFQRDTVAEQEAGACVPIGYNKDKSEIPVFSRGCGFVLVLFPLEKLSKMGVK